MAEHILVRYAKKYPTPNPIAASESSIYDVQKGYWLLKTTQEPMMTSSNSIRPTTKKFDRETGEDMKGE